MSPTDIAKARRWVESAENDLSQLSTIDRMRFKLEIARAYAQIHQAEKVR